MKNIRRNLAILALAVMACSPSPADDASTSKAQAVTVGPLEVDLVTLDTSGPVDPWGKTVGDIDGDGLTDFVVQGHADGGIAWYENDGDLSDGAPKHTIATGGGFRTDVEVADVNDDGRADVVTLHDDGVRWYEQPAGGATLSGWAFHVVSTTRLHDVEVGDVNGDGLPDIVGRNQTPFEGNGDFLAVYLQTNPTTWTAHTLPAPHGEGLLLRDVDGDGALDLIVNGIWYENDGDVSDGFPAHVYSSTAYANVAPAFGDLNGDGRADIVLAPSEGAGDYGKEMVWYEAPLDRTQAWTPHVIESNLQAVWHSAAIADFDEDGRADVITAEMPQSDDDDEVVVHLNTPTGWAKHVIDIDGSHSIRVGDFDQDGDPDIFGANWNAEGKDEFVKLWINETAPQVLPLDSWELHVIDSTKPAGSIFAFPADLDSDGLPEIVTGAHYYQHAGDLSAWTRHDFDAPANNAYFAHDFDADGDLDVLASQGIGQAHSGAFAWARNDGGTFTTLTNVTPSSVGDFAQGVAVVESTVAISWHAGPGNVEGLTIPSDPSSTTWPISQLAASQDEGLSAGDIDGDGDDDLFQGSQWLENTGSGWVVHSVASFGSAPDRNRLADIDGDGDLDAVVGFEGNSVALVWLEAPADPTQAWTVHTIAPSVGGGYSLDVGDLDNDGDPDVVLGEHQGAKRLLAYRNDGATWDETVIHSGGFGFDHHDGTRLADFDGDGDLDVVSIVWNDAPGSVYVWENLALDSQGPGGTGGAGGASGDGGSTSDGGTSSGGAASGGASSGGASSGGAGAGGSGGALSDPDLLAHWDFDSETTPGLFGAAYDFDGTGSDYVDAPGFDAGGGDEVTVTALIYARSFHEWFFDDRIFSQATGTGEGDHWLMLSGIRHNDAPHLRLRLKTGSTSTLIGTGAAIPLGAWAAIAAVYDGSEMRLYLDGALVGSTPKTGAMPSGASIPARIGLNPDGYGAFDGLIDDLRVYTRALSDLEIQALYSGNPPPPPPPQNDPPVAAFTLTCTAEMTSTSSDSDGTIEAMVWEVDGQVVGSGATITQSFGSGSSSIELFVTDDDGATSSTARTLSIQ